MSIERMEELLRELRIPLGELAMEFARLEDTTTMAINTLMRLETVEGWILETIMRDFSSRVRLFAGLVNLHVKDEKLRKLGNRVASLMRQANSDRNNLLHDAWSNYSPDHDALSKIRYAVADDGALAQLPLYNISIELVQETTNFILRTGLATEDWRTRFNHANHFGDRPELLHSPLPDKFYEGSPLHNHMKRQKKK
jgi:hypothetical protein